jgi:MFS family permease
LAITSQFAYTFVTVMSALSIAPMFPLLGEEFELDEQQLGMLTGVAVITLGYVNFFIVPFSNILGRRLTSILFGIFVVATSIWVALATSYGNLLAARALNGLATGTNESLMMQVVADIFFLHERGLWSGIYL